MKFIGFFYIIFYLLIICINIEIIKDLICIFSYIEIRLRE